MILQEPAEINFISIMLGVIFIFALFIIGLGLTIYRASNQDLDSSYQKATLINFIWLIIDFIFWGLIYVIISSTDLTYNTYFALFWILIIIKSLVKIPVGGAIASRLYNLTFRQAISFVVVIVVILFIFGVIIDSFIRPIIWYIIL